MRLGHLEMVAALLAACGVVTVIGAPVAGADSCDPAVTICQGSDVQSGSGSSDFSPSVSAADEQYPFDNEWYFNPAGGNTALQPDHGSGGGGGGGGGHR